MRRRPTGELRGVFRGRAEGGEESADLEACFLVRKEVFVSEQGVPEDLEYDAYDASAVHVLALGPDGPLGTGRLVVGAEGYGASVGKLGRLAVRPLRGAWVWVLHWCGGLRRRPRGSGVPRLFLGRRSMRWGSMSGSGMWPMGPSSMMRGFRIGLCGVLSEAVGAGPPVGGFLPSPPLPESDGRPWLRPRTPVALRARPQTPERAGWGSDRLGGGCVVLMVAWHSCGDLAWQAAGGAPWTSWRCCSCCCSGPW